MCVLLLTSAVQSKAPRSNKAAGLPFSLSSLLPDPSSQAMRLLFLLLALGSLSELPHITNSFLLLNPITVVSLRCIPANFPSTCVHHHIKPLLPSSSSRRHRLSRPLLAAATLSSSPSAFDIITSLPHPSPAVISSVGALGCRSLTVPSVVSATGLPSSEVSLELQSLSYLTGGTLSVSSDGSLSYSFPPDFESVLSRRSRRQRLRNILSRLRAPFLSALRLSFGVVLFVSLGLVFFFLSALSAPRRQDEETDQDGDGRRRGAGSERRRQAPPQRHVHIHVGGPNIFWGPSPFDLLFYRYPSPSDPPPVNILSSIFSYVFGDGPSNPDLSSDSIRLASAHVRRRGGLVPAADLAAFLPNPPSGSSTQLLSREFFISDSHVLPLVAALGGRPVVSGKDVLYFFPDQQCPPSAAANPVVGAFFSSAAASSPIVEHPEEFSRAPVPSQILAGLLGGVLLTSVVRLSQLCGALDAASVQLPQQQRQLLGAARKLLPALWGYALMFNVVPAIRALTIWRENRAIECRNDARRKFAEEADKFFKEVGKKNSTTGTAPLRFDDEDDLAQFDDKMKRAKKGKR